MLKAKPGVVTKPAWFALFHSHALGARVESGIYGCLQRKQLRHKTKMRNQPFPKTLFAKKIPTYTFLLPRKT